MKTLYIRDILRKNIGEEFLLLGWLRSKRSQGGLIFIELVDSTGAIEITVRKDIVKADIFETVKKISKESALKIWGKIEKIPERQKKDFIAKNVEIINTAILHISPSPRENFNVFSSKYANLILRQRHLFLRNPRISAVLKIKSVLLEAFRAWFKKQGFVEIDTPVLTQATLYEDDATFKIDYFGTETYLSQCAGLYLGALVPVFEKVYTITPAFRRQPSRSPRHNPEFWHVKGQAAFFNLNEMSEFVENMIYYVINYIIDNCGEELKILNIKPEIGKIKPPYQRITYTEAIKFLKSKNIDLKWGKSLNEAAEKIVADKFKRPVFVTGMPRRVEPFPYSCNSLDQTITNTADLLAPDGYGEILGLAEFIYKKEELIERMKEGGKYQQPERFKWYLELAQYGLVPRSGFGIGVERLLRWLLRLPHVSDAFPFPRLYRRLPYP